MIVAVADCESCDPQHLKEDVPSHTWDLDRLSALARTEHAAILTEEKSTTARYWRLGQVLHLARKQFAHGQWLRYLQDLGIEKTRAVKALRIFETFSTEAQTAGLTVAEAYDKRRRRPQAARAERGDQKPIQEEACAVVAATSTWRRFAAAIGDEIDRLKDEPEFLTAAEAAEALTETERAVAALLRLTERLRERSNFIGPTSC